MKKEIGRKLTVRKETLRALADRNLERARGGYTFPSITCGNTCVICLTNRCSPPAPEPK